MASNDVAAWMERYLRAWSSNDPDDIGALFTDDARYYTAPHRQPWSGREEIVREWLDRKDDPGTWDFRWEELARAGDLAFIRGWTSYRGQEPAEYSNLWVIRMEGDRCSEYTEWWMDIPAGEKTAT
jgi:ketosteroid isomerase-like protein